MTSTSVDRIYGLSSSAAIKAPVRVASTAAITLSGLQTVDGVVLAAGDRVLVKDQTDTTTNGIYVAATSAWQRDQDFDGARDVAKGTIIRVNEGSTWAGFFFALTTTGTIVFGTSAITFATTGGPGISAAMLPVVSAATLATARTAMAVLGTAGGSMTGAINEAYIASAQAVVANVIDLSGIAANFIDLSQSQNVNIAGFGSLPAGAERTIRFAGATPGTLVQGGALTLPGAASIPLGQFDIIKIRSFGSSVVELVGMLPYTGPAIYGKASKADQQTPTDANKFVTPAQQHQHPSALKGFGVVASAGSAVVGGYPSSASSVRNGTGDYTITHGRSMVNTNYPAGATTETVGVSASIVSRTNSQLQILVTTTSTGAAVDANVDYWFAGTLA